MKTLKTVDACGLSCPQPALLTSRALNSTSSGEVQVSVDSVTARDNVVRVAQRAGWHTNIEERADGSFQIRLTK